MKRYQAKFLHVDTLDYEDNRIVHRITNKDCEWLDQAMNQFLDGHEELLSLPLWRRIREYLRAGQPLETLHLFFTNADELDDIRIEQAEAQFESRMGGRI